MGMEETTIQYRTLFTGRVVGLELHEVQLANGRQASREVVRHVPAAGVVAEMADGRFAFVRQYRKPVEQAVLEIVAGVCEPGEEPETTARRELREESGYDAVALTRLGAIYPSPGYVDEVIHLYHARLAPEPAGTALDEDEHVQLEVYTADEVWALIDAGAIQDAKTLTAWFWLHQRRER